MSPSPSTQISTLLSQLQDPDAQVRQSALDTLGEWTHRENIHPDASALRLVYQLLADPDSRVRLKACTALALIPGSVDILQDRVAFLHNRIEDSHPEVRAQAIAAIGDLAKMGLTIPPATTDILASCVGRPEPDGFEAAYTLAIINDLRGLNRLELSLRNTHLRPLALEGIGRLRQSSSIPILRQYTRRWLISWSDRFITWAVLGHLGDATGSQQIVRNLQSRRFEERVFACVLAGQWQIEDARKTLSRLAGASDETAREAAIEALGNIAHEDDRNFLEALVSDPTLHPNTLQVAKKALKNLLTKTRI